MKYRNTDFALPNCAHKLFHGRAVVQRTHVFAADTGGSVLCHPGELIRTCCAYDAPMKKPDWRTNRQEVILSEGNALAKLFPATEIARLVVRINQYPCLMLERAGVAAGAQHVSQREVLIEYRD
jgi:hypothetical protein